LGVQNVKYVFPAPRERHHATGTDRGAFFTGEAYGQKLAPEFLIVLQQLGDSFSERGNLPDDFRRRYSQGKRSPRPTASDFSGRALARSAGIWRDHLERGMADRRAEKSASFIGELEKPARPAPRIAARLGIGQIVHDRHCLVAGGRSVRQLDPFLVPHDALAEAEVEKVARHDPFSCWTEIRKGAVGSTTAPRGYERLC
jgi:hypothetical protein